MLAQKIAAAAVLSLMSVSVAVPAHAASAAPKKFSNCTAMNKAYPHGVGRPGAVDKTSGTRVTTFKRDAALYAANSGSDGDKDGIACEKL